MITLGEAIQMRLQVHLGAKLRGHSPRDLSHDFSMVNLVHAIEMIEDGFTQKEWDLGRRQLGFEFVIQPTALFGYFVQ
jgi:hypothetical protein